MKRRTTTIFLAVLAVQPGVRVDGAGGWSVCELSKPVESEAKHALERFTSSLPPALFRERYVDQRPALLSGEAVPPQNDPAQYWSRSGMLTTWDFLICGLVFFQIGCRRNHECIKKGNY